jgi:hypothetical protein
VPTLTILVTQVSLLRLLFKNFHWYFTQKLEKVNADFIPAGGVDSVDNFLLCVVVQSNFRRRVEVAAKFDERIV